jgi:hypothetical protein
MRVTVVILLPLLVLVLAIIALYWSEQQQLGRAPKNHNLPRMWFDAQNRLRAFYRMKLIHHGRRFTKHTNNSTGDVWSGDGNGDRNQSQHDRVFDNCDAFLVTFLLHHIPRI